MKCTTGILTGLQLETFSFVSESEYVCPDGFQPTKALGITRENRNIPVSSSVAQNTAHGDIPDVLSNNGTQSSESKCFLFV